MRRLVAIPVALALIHGCASPGAEYKQLQVAEKSNGAVSFQEVIRSTQAITLPSPGKKTVKRTIKLEKTDPTLSLGGYSSYFKLFQVNLTGGRKYVFSAFGITHPAFPEFATVVPRLYVLDSQANLIEEGPRIYFEDRPVGEMSVMIPRDGTYDLIVAADNSDVGNAIGTVKGGKATTIDKNGKTVVTDEDLLVDVLSSPTGKVGVQIKERR